jgi:hypothetical protein
MILKVRKDIIGIFKNPKTFKCVSEQGMFCTQGCAFLGI